MVETANQERTDISIPKEMVEDIVSNHLPSTHPFTNIYENMDSYATKYALAVALLQDGRYSDLRFLVNKFILPNGEVDSDVEKLREDLEVRTREVLIARGDKKEARTAVDSLKKFAEDVVSGDTLDSQRFRRLISVLSPSRAVDILYKFRPEFRGLPVENIKSVLADYLGDFLVVRPPFNPPDVEDSLEYLSDATLREGLVEVIKDSCVANFNAQKKAKVETDDSDIVQDYLDTLKSEFFTFTDDELESIVDEVDTYYKEVFANPKPSNLVDKLNKDRNFPDFGQGINIKEIKGKRRMLIADKMGLGKSASAILAKESLGVGTALVVVPSDVVSTWQEYLSDKVDSDGKQVGYFKEGQVPRVLVIEEPSSLEGKDLTDYEYVVISHERLSETYTPELIDGPFGMLIVDEVHKLKNIKEGVRANNLLKIAEKINGEGKYLVMLSGTPVPNKIQDVAMILKLLYPEKFAEIDNKELVRQILRGDVIDLRNLLLPRMQAKDLSETLEMPALIQREEFIDLSAEEEELYEALLEEDEILATSKLQILRQFLLNPDILRTTPGVIGTKIKEVGRDLRRMFGEKSKIVMFVNGYIEDVIRGDKNIIEKLGLPEDVEVQVVEGNVDKKRRAEIQKRFKETNGKILIIFSGETVDVGIDYSSGQAVIHYNEPWTKYKKEQQTCRVHRPGVKGDVEEVTFIVRNSIEEGIKYYIEAKHRAIQKLLYGIPITELERDLLERSSEEIDTDDLEVNSELAGYYFSAWDRMMKIFAYTREIGENEFVKFLENYGQAYAECYLDLGNRSYQANAARICATIIDRLAIEKDQKVEDLTILDIASGPEVLRKHVLEKYQNRIVSLDINPHHFQGEGGKRVLGSFKLLPFFDNSVDYANLSLALHYTKLVPSQNEYERMAVLLEIGRVLKVGGTAIINNIYSADFRDESKFRKFVEALGLRLREDYSGQATSGDNYKSKVFVLEKVEDRSNLRITISPESVDTKEDTQSQLEKIVDILGLDKDDLDGIKLAKTGARVKNSRKVITQFSINDQAYQVFLNPDDKEVLWEEEEVLEQGEQLKSLYGTIENIPREEVINHHFVRFYNGKRFVLFKKLSKGRGAVIVR